MNLTSVLITVAFLVLGYLIGVVRPTGLLSRRPARWSWTPVYAVLGLFGAMVLWFGGYQAFWQRLQTEVDGKVVARREIPRTPENHGASVIYTFEGRGGTRSDYTAAPGDGPLPQSFPIGTSVDKRKWELGYTLNGERVDDFPIIPSLMLMGFGLVCLVSATILLRRASAASSRGPSRT